VSIHQPKKKKNQENILSAEHYSGSTALLLVSINGKIRPFGKTALYECSGSMSMTEKRFACASVAISITINDIYPMANV